MLVNCWKKKIVDIFLGFFEVLRVFENNVFFCVYYDSKEIEERMCMVY